MGKKREYTYRYPDPPCASCGTALEPEDVQDCKSYPVTTWRSYSSGSLKVNSCQFENSSKNIVVMKKDMHGSRNGIVAFPNHACFIKAAGNY